MTNSLVKKLTITILVIVLLVACLSIFAACNIDFDDIEVTFKDMKGREFTLKPADVQKVVCVGAGALRLYTYVGDMSKLYAVEEIECSRTGFVSVRPYQIAYENEFKAIIEAGRTAGPGGPQAQVLQTEILAQLEPDVVFSCLTLETSVIEDAEKAIGCPIVTLAYGKEKAFSSELKSSLGIISLVCGTEARAAEVVVAMEALEADIKAKAKDKTSATVYLGCNSNWGKKGFLSTSKQYPIFTISGIKNVMDEDGKTISGAGMADLEQVVTSDTTKIILDAGGLSIFEHDYKETGSELPATLATMTAFAGKEVYLMMPNNAYDANVEMYFINAYYALSVAYGIEIDMPTQAKEILDLFYGEGKVTYDDVKMYGGYQKLNLPDVWPTNA